MNTTAAEQALRGRTEPDSVIVRARAGWQLLDLWRYRELLWFLALRDVQVRYKQAALGFLWAILQPAAAVVVMVFFFGELGGLSRRVDSPYPYPIFVYAGTLPWMFFAAAVGASAGSLISNAGMVQKVYFPRLIVPVAAVGAPLVDYVMGFSVLLALMVYYQVAVSWHLLWLPLLIATLIVCALAVGVALSALTVAYRDFRYVVPFVIQLGLLATPAVYFNVDPLPARFQRYEWLVNLNPLNGPIAAFRAALLGQPINFVAWAGSALVMLLLLAVGLAYFKHTERRFADII